MIPRRVFAILTTVLVILIVIVTVLLAFQSLLIALGDAAAAKVVLWIALGCLVGLAVDTLLLVGALGVNAMRSPDDSEGD